MTKAQPEQGNIFDWMRETFSITDSLRARDEAIQLAEAGRTQKWRDDAYQAVERCARERQYLISDDCWRYMQPRQRKGEARALGAILLKAQRAGMITGTNEYRQTARVSAHAARVRVWRSNVFGTA